MPSSSIVIYFKLILCSDNATLLYLDILFIYAFQNMHELDFPPNTVYFLWITYVYYWIL